MKKIIFAIIMVMFFTNISSADNNANYILHFNNVLTEKDNLNIDLVYKSFQENNSEITFLRGLALQKVIYEQENSVSWKDLRKLHNLYKNEVENNTFLPDILMNEETYNFLEAAVTHADNPKMMKPYNYFIYFDLKRFCIQDSFYEHSLILLLISFPETYQYKDEKKLNDIVRTLLKKDEQKYISFLNKIGFSWYNDSKPMFQQMFFGNMSLFPETVNFYKDNDSAVLDNSISFIRDEIYDISKVLYDNESRINTFTVIENNIYIVVRFKNNLHLQGYDKNNLSNRISDKILAQGTYHFFDNDLYMEEPSENNMCNIYKIDLITLEKKYSFSIPNNYRFFWFLYDNIFSFCSYPDNYIFKIGTDERIELPKLKEGWKYCIISGYKQDIFLFVSRAMYCGIYYKDKFLFCSEESKVMYKMNPRFINGKLYFQIDNMIISYILKESE